MNEKRINFGLVLIGLVFLETVEADNRAYVWTYEYKTMPAGEAELEYCTTFHSPRADSLEDDTTAEHNIELKIGINNRFDVGLYQVFE